ESNNDPSRVETLTNKTIIKTYVQFTNLFRQRFKRQEEEEHEAAASLWEIHQQPGQTTEDFVNKIWSFGTRINARSQDMFNAAINGLRENIKSQILIKGQPKDLDQKIRWGTNAEKYNINTSDPIADLVRDLNE